MGKVIWEKIPVPISVTNRETNYKQLKLNNVSNNYLFNFIKSRKKFFKQLRKLYKKGYRQAYELLQKRGFVLTGPMID